MSYVGNVSPIFAIADQHVRRHEPEVAQRRPRRPRPMPRIQANPNIKRPMDVTDDFIENWELHKKVEKEKTISDYEKKITDLLAKRDRLNAKLATLDIRKKKEAKKIGAYNAQLLDLEREIKEIQEKSGLDINHLKKGSKLSKFIARLKERARSFNKKMKKYWKKYWHGDPEKQKKNPFSIIFGVIGTIVASVTTLFIAKRL